RLSRRRRCARPRRVRWRRRGEVVLTMSTKVLVCRCEDVTLGDIQHAVSLGYRDIEEVKRYTGLGTGPCEGKECMALCAMLLAKNTGMQDKQMRPFTSRPPVQPISFAALARGDEPDGGRGK